MDHLEKAVFCALTVVTVGLLGLIAWGVLYTTTNCTATEDTRLSNRLTWTGKVAVPMAVVERRYVCPDGELWL